MNSPKPWQIYKHFKGMLYQIITLAEHSETGEMMVIYQALYGTFKIYARPLSMFLEKVDKEKYPGVSQEYRFELQENLQGAAAGSVPEGATANPVCEKQAVNEQVLKEQVSEEVAADGEEGFALEPMVLEFLDADSYEERLNILTALHHRITDEMITTMAVAVDVEIEDGDVEERYQELRKCLLLYDKFECNRLR